MSEQRCVVEELDEDDYCYGTAGHCDICFTEKTVVAEDDFGRLICADCLEPADPEKETERNGER